MKLVSESVNEYVSHADDTWANRELDRWEMKKKGLDPFKEYTKKVIKLIWAGIPDYTAKDTGISPEIIEDLITDTEDGIITNSVYDYYDNNVDEEAAAIELGTQISNYIR